MDILSLISNLGNVILMYLIIFISEVLTKGTLTYSDSVMHILVFTVLHLIFFVKYILAEIIPDEPDWITKDR